MASLTSIRNGLGTNLENISSLTVFKFVPDFVEPPTAVVGVVELIEYDIKLGEKPFVVVGNKMDEENAAKYVTEFSQRFPGIELHTISALLGDGLPHLKKKLLESLS